MAKRKSKRSKDSPKDKIVNLSKNRTVQMVSAFVILTIIAVVVFNMVNEGEKNQVVLHTNMGDIRIALYEHMPLTTSNFKKLVGEGFYDGIIFHRVIEGFMIQGGDPTGTGSGGPGYTITDEFTDFNKNDKFTLSMANAGPNTGGSQFFINLADNNYLDTRHPVFGKVIEGMAVVEKIGKTKTDKMDRPLEEVKIISAELV